MHSFAVGEIGISWERQSPDWHVLVFANVLELLVEEKCQSGDWRSQDMQSLEMGEI